MGKFQQIQQIMDLQNLQLQVVLLQLCQMECLLLQWEVRKVMAKMEIQFLILILVLSEVERFLMSISIGKQVTLQVRVKALAHRYIFLTMKVKRY